MALDPQELLNGGPKEAEVAPAPLAGTRSQRIQRLQVGLFGLGTMILIVGLANIIMSSAKQNQATSLPEEVPVAATEDVQPAAPSNPLADAGVVPEIPSEPPAQATSTPAPQPSVIGNATPSPVQN